MTVDAAAHVLLLRPHDGGRTSSPAVSPIFCIECTSYVRAFSVYGVRPPAKGENSTGCRVVVVAKRIGNVVSVPERRRLSSSVRVRSSPSSRPHHYNITPHSATQRLRAHALPLSLSLYP